MSLYVFLMNEYILYFEGITINKHGHWFAQGQTSKNTSIRATQGATEHTRSSMFQEEEEETKPEGQVGSRQMKRVAQEKG